MARIFILILSCLAPFSIHAANIREPTCLPLEADILRKATDTYLNFINQIGRGSDFPQDEASAEILCPDCKKILNGELFTQSREEFVEDLISVYIDQGAWQVYPADTIIAPSSNTVVLRLFIEMEKWGAYTAIVILRYNSDCLITEINEVINQVKGSYEFKEGK